MRDYIGGLTGTRYVGASDSTEVHVGISRWIALFAAASRRAVEDAGRFEARVRSLQDSWHERLGSIRRDSAARLLIESLPASPVPTVSTAAELPGRSFQATNQAVGQLTEADVLVQVNFGRRNRAFESPELIEAFTALERQLASPEGDTRVSGHARLAPQRLD